MPRKRRVIHHPFLVGYWVGINISQLHQRFNVVRCLIFAAAAASSI
jgi:hypothetical protein